MQQIDMHRMAAIMTSIEKYGMEADIASKVALALHPLDDSPVPSRGFEKEVRKASRRYAKQLRNLKGQPVQAERLAVQTLKGYKSSAQAHGESHYINRYDKAIGQH